MTNRKYKITRVLLIWITEGFRNRVRSQFDGICEDYQVSALRLNDSAMLIETIEGFYGKETWLSPLFARIKRWVRRLLLLGGTDALCEPGRVVVVEEELFELGRSVSNRLFETIRKSLAEYRPIIALAVSSDNIDSYRREAYEAGIDIILDKEFLRQRLEDEVYVRLRADAEGSRSRKEVVAWGLSVLISIAVATVTGVLTLSLKEFITGNLCSDCDPYWSVSISAGKPGENPTEYRPVNGSYWLPCTIVISNDKGMSKRGFGLRTNLSGFGLGTNLPSTVPNRIEVGRSEAIPFIIEIPESLSASCDPDSLRLFVDGPDGWWARRPEERKLPDQVIRSFQILRQRSKGLEQAAGAGPNATNRSNP